MVDNLYTELSRSKLIFKKLVESYLKTGSPAGSETIMKMGGFNLSSASIGSILSDLQKKVCFTLHTGQLAECPRKRECVFSLMDY